MTAFYGIFDHYIRLKVHFFVPNPKSQVPNLPKSMGWVGYWTYMRKVCENGKMWKHLVKTLLRVDLSGPAQGNPLGKKQSKHSLCLSKPRQYGQDCLETILKDFYQIGVVFFSIFWPCCGSNCEVIKFLGRNMLCCPGRLSVALPALFVA